MENPTDRVTYGDLRMIRAEFEELMQLSIEAGTIKHPIPYESYMDESFARHAQPAADLALSEAPRALAALLLLLLWRPPAGAADDAEPQGGRLQPAARRARVLAARIRRRASSKLSRYRGKVVVLGFGFTSCPDVCPTTLATLAAARARSSGAKGDELQVVYVTVDPERDDAERLREVPRELRPDLRRRHRHAPSSWPPCARSTGSPPRGRTLGRRLRVRPLVVHLPDRSPGKPARADAVRALARRLRARRRDPARSRERRRAAHRVLLAGCALAVIALGGAGADPLRLAGRAVRDPEGHLGAPHGRRPGRRSCPTRSA